MALIQQLETSIGVTVAKGGLLTQSLGKPVLTTQLNLTVVLGGTAVLGLAVKDVILGITS
jgi:hypothetical protein